METNINFDSVRFPGRAGALQAANATPALISELGANYAGYHDHLRTELAGLSRPDPRNYTDGEEYFADWSRLEDLVKAESYLRTCRAHRISGHPLDAAAYTHIALVDDQNHLVSVE